MLNRLRFLSRFSFVCLLLLPVAGLHAQKFPHGGAYMAFIGEQYRQITQDMLSYTSAVAHSKNARKVEAKRKALLTTTRDARKKISAMPAYEGDKSLRDSVTAFLHISYIVLNEDYGKILNLEEVAEQSYDGMEAYFLAQDLADRKLNQASARLRDTERAFAQRHNVKLVESEDELERKIKKANQVSEYNRKVYLIFFKSYKQEAYLLDALQKKDLNAIEQNRNALLRHAEEGLARLDTLKPFLNDRTLATSCRQMLSFYKAEAEEKIPVMTAFYLKEENFQKMKKAFEAKKQNERSKEDVDQFNAAVSEINASSAELNKTTSTLFASRSKLIDQYNKASQSYLAKHTPHYK